MELSTRARRRLSTVLALVLAAESVSAVSVAATSVDTGQAHVGSAPAAVMADRPATLPIAANAAGAAAAAIEVPVAQPRVDPPTIELPVQPPASPEPASTTKGQHGARPSLPEEAANVAKAAPKAGATDPKTPKPADKPGPKHDPKPAPKPASYAGTNHVWIPSLGISRSVRWFPCDRTREPDNYMYRWGCAGANNVYLLGHAWGVMAPLHDAYVSGRLRVGMKAYYAGADGKVHVYAVKWWKLTRPTTDASWAWASLSVPSMTLQTCVGANSEWRLMVRLVEVNG